MVRAWFTALRGRRLALVCAGVLAALVVAAWLALAVATHQHLFGSARVSGVAVGGMSPAAARDAVASELGAQLAQPVTVTVGQRSDELVPADAGVSVDAAASVKRLTGWTANPVTLVRRLAGAQVDAVAAVDADALRLALDARLSTLASGAADAAVTLEGTTPRLTPARTGTGLDVEAALTQLSQAWPWGRETITLPEGVAQPAVTDADAQTFIDQVLTPLLSAPVTVTAAGTGAEGAPDASLTPEQLAAATRISVDEGRLTAVLDPQVLREDVLVAMGEGVEQEARDATYTIEGSAAGTPVFEAAQVGRTIDADALAQAVLAAAVGEQEDQGAATPSSTDPAEGGGEATSQEAAASDPIVGERTIRLPLTQTQPDHADSEQDLGVTQVVGEYATTYFYDPVRTQNLRTGTAAINGTLVRAGETFSLEEALGPVDTAHGFAAAGVLTNGVHSEAVGGGLSQVATTTFNAAFEAGMDDVEHHPHSVWFRRYPAGREATLWTGVLDVKWRNSTPYAALVQAWLEGSQVRVRLWSTPYYQVAITSSERTNVRPAEVRTSSAAGCTPYGAGQNGFDITVTRTRTAPDGTAQNDDVLRTSYQADHGRRCVSAESDEES